MRDYFSGLFGNDETKHRVGKAVENGTIPHAFLIGGPSGSGKSTLATEIAAAINCEEKHNSAVSLPCRTCSRCRRIFEGNFPDYKILAKKKDKATLGVDAVKEFREDMFLSSTESDYKIYVIDDAECMTTEAQNALLKVLEEPPKSVMIFLLASECDRILTTIKSRAQYIAMGRFSEEELSSILLKDSSEARMAKVANEARFRSLIMSADGRIGLAKELFGKKLSDENEEERADIIALINAVSKKPCYSGVYSALSRFSTKRVEFSSSLEKLMSALRDLIVLKHYSEAKTVFFTSKEEALSMVNGVSTKRLLAVYDAVNETHALCAKNANTSNLLTNLCSKIIFAVNN